MKTIQSWSHVRNLLPDGKLKGGLNSVEEDLNSLLGYQYVSAFNKRKGISTMTFLDPDVYNDDDWCSAQAEADENWDKRKVIHLWTPELIATVDATLGGTVTKHVGVQQGGGQEAEEDDGVEDKQSTDNCKCRLKLAWWEQRTQWHYRHWKQLKKDLNFFGQWALCAAELTLARAGGGEDKKASCRDSMTLC